MRIRYLALSPRNHQRLQELHLNEELRLTLSDSKMSKEDQDLLERNGKIVNNKHEPQPEVDINHLQEDGFQNEYNEEFWRKVSLDKQI